MARDSELIFAEQPRRRRWPLFVLAAGLVLLIAAPPPLAVLLPAGVQRVDAARGVLKFHIQSTVTLGSERDTNNVASIGDGKPGEFRVSEDRTAFWLDDNVRQLTGAVEHEHKLGEKSSGG